MLLPNDVIEYAAEPARVLRILWISPNGQLAWIYELQRRGSLPQAAEISVLVDDLKARRARLLLPDPYRARHVDAPSDGNLRVQTKAWDAVRTLHADLPALYAPRTRAALLAACSAQHGITGATLLRYLRRYWERGQVIDALLPDYANSGARGKTRNANANAKRGRPRNGAVMGANVDPAMRAVFQAAAARYAAEHPRFSRPAAYRQMLAEHFGNADPGAIPTYGQFNYWLERAGVGAPD